MVPYQLPGTAARVPVLWSEPRMQPWLAFAAAESRLGRRAHGGLIVDLDDTLYPREEFVRSGFATVARAVARTHGIAIDAALETLSRAHATEQRGREFQVLCETHRLPAALIPELIALFREHRPSLSLAPGIVETLKALRRQGWRIAILTNGLPSVQAGKVAALGLTRYVDHVLYAERYAPGGKPSPAAFHAAVLRLGVPADWCVCVGDDPVCDIGGAQRAGIRAVQLITAGHRVVEEADAAIRRFEDLPAAAASLIDLVNLDVA